MKMKAFFTAKRKFLFLALLLLIAVSVSACDRYERGRACAEGADCRYYTGSEGVVSYLERPPRTLAYYSSDTGPDANMVELSVRTVNRGASHSYGAVFLTGFGPTFDVWISDERGERPLNLRANPQHCTFDFFGIGTGSFPSFRVDCGGIGVERTPRGTINIGAAFDEIARTFGVDFLPSGVRVGITGGGDAGFAINVDLGGVGGMDLLVHGKILVGLVYDVLNFYDFGGSDFVIAGENPETLVGGEKYTNFLVQMQHPWPAGRDTIEIPYNIKTCYAYTTFVSPEICVDPRPFSAEEKVCRAEQTISMGTQGAPIAVTEVRQSNTGREVILEFTIRNVGRGTVWDVGYLERCSPYFPDTPRASMKNVVYVGFAQLDGRPLECDRYTLRLDPNTESQRFQCRYPLDESALVGSAYVSPLRMELWYGYEETIRSSLSVRRYN